MPFLTHQHHRACLAMASGDGTMKLAANQIATGVIALSASIGTAFLLALPMAHGEPATAHPYGTEEVCSLSRCWRQDRPPPQTPGGQGIVDFVRQAQQPTAGDWRQAATILRAVVDAPDDATAAPTHYAEVRSHLLFPQENGPVIAFCGSYTFQNFADTRGPPEISGFIAARGVWTGHVETVRDQGETTPARFAAMWKIYCTGPAGPDVWESANTG